LSGGPCCLPLFLPSRQQVNGCTLALRQQFLLRSPFMRCAYVSSLGSTHSGSKASDISPECIKMSVNKEDGGSKVPRWDPRLPTFDPRQSPRLIIEARELITPYMSVYPCVTVAVWIRWAIETVLPEGVLVSLLGSFPPVDFCRLLGSLLVINNSPKTQ